MHEIRTASKSAKPTTKDTNRACVRLMGYLTESTAREAFLKKYRLFAVDWGLSKTDCAVEVCDLSGSEVWLVKDMPCIVKYHYVVEPGVLKLGRRFLELKAR